MFCKASVSVFLHVDNVTVTTRPNEFDRATHMLSKF